MSNSCYITRDKTSFKNSLLNLHSRAQIHKVHYLDKSMS